MSGSTNRSAISLLLFSDSHFVFASLSSSPSCLLPQSLWQIWHELSFLSSCAIRLQWVPGHSFLPSNVEADELARRGTLLVFSAIPCSLSSFISRIHSGLFLNWRRTVSYKFFNTQIRSVSTEELVFSRHTRSAFFCLRCSGNSSLLSCYLTKIGRIENPTCSYCNIRPRMPFISFCTVPLRTLCTAYSLATFCLSTTSGPGLEELFGLWAPLSSAMPPFFGRGRVTTTITMEGPTIS